MTRILLLTHTNPHEDSRIQKMYEAAKKVTANPYVLGLQRGKMESTTIEFEAVRIKTKPIVAWLQTKRHWPRPLRIFLSLTVYVEVIIQLFYKCLRVRPTIIHVNDWYVLPIAVAVKTLLNSTIIYDAHELESETSSTTAKLSKLVVLIERLCWQSVSTLITVSPSIQQWYIEKYGNKESYVILNSPQIRLYTHPNNTNPAPNYFRSEFGIPDSTLIFLYLGALERGRGIEIILESFLETKSDSAVIFMGSGSYESKIRKYSELSEKIFYHEKVSHDQVTTVASHADFGLCIIENVSLSDWMCLPNKLFEYLFAGLPVISSDFPELRRIILTNNFGLCIEPKKSALSEVLRSSLSKSMYQSNMHDSMIQQFSWENQEQAVIEIYRRFFD